MNDKTEINAQQPTAEAEPPTVQVMTRFTRAELDALKRETGATADATAIACFVRRNLRKVEP
jgi:hypothetical protein